MATYLEEGPKSLFDMKNYAYCVIGHTGRALGIRIFACHEVAEKVYGITGADNFQFCFGARWGLFNDPKAAADRLRYVALHGSAPDKEQWHRFQTHPQPVVESVEVEDKPVEEKELATAE